jgi:hypothetical protein
VAWLSLYRFYAWPGAGSFFNSVNLSTCQRQFGLQPGRRQAIKLKMPVFEQGPESGWK